MASGLILPNIRGYDFGVGVDRLSGVARNQVVRPEPSPPMPGTGGVRKFDVSRVTSSQDLQKKLGIDVAASYGCAAFGAGASARFAFVEESAVHSSSLFMSITATVMVADLSIDAATLTDNAGAIIGQPELFTTRYGDLFCRSCSRGGLFVGMMRVEAFSASQANEISIELKGSYGLFGADAQAKFKNMISTHNVSVYCTVYAEGGPALQIGNPTDPQEFLQQANAWMRSFDDDPDRYARPYEWTMAPISIADGPRPPNDAQLQHAQDVLRFCARERTVLLDQVSTLAWYQEHPDRYDWATTSVTPAEVRDAVGNAQRDLDLVARCASAAIDNPADALLPETYAAAMNPPATYRQWAVPSPLPQPKEPDLLPSVLEPFAGSWSNVDPAVWLRTVTVRPERDGARLIMERNEMSTRVEPAVWDADAVALVCTYRPESRPGTTTLFLRVNGPSPLELTVDVQSHIPGTRRDYWSTYRFRRA